MRRHPWRMATLVALGAGLALGLAHAVGEGGLPPLHRLPLAVLASLIIATIEGTAVLVSYLVLGRYLGVWGRPAGGCTSEAGPLLTP
jgi:hypothetical protein